MTGKEFSLGFGLVDLRVMKMDTRIDRPVDSTSRVGWSMEEVRPMIGGRYVLPGNSPRYVFYIFFLGFFLEQKEVKLGGSHR